MANSSIPPTDSTFQVNRPTFYTDLARVLCFSGVTPFDVLVHVKFWLNNDDWCEALSPQQHDEFINDVYYILALLRKQPAAAPDASESEVDGE